MESGGVHDGRAARLELLLGQELLLRGLHMDHRMRAGPVRVVGRVLLAAGQANGRRVLLQTVGRHSVRQVQPLDVVRVVVAGPVGLLLLTGRVLELLRLVHVLHVVTVRVLVVVS